MGVETNLMPVVSKIYCSPLKTQLIVRKRPRVINGGGFVVMDYNQQLIFTVDGCGSLGSNGELMLSDGNGAPILFIRKKEGMVQALSVRNQWRGYHMDYDGLGKLCFSLQEPKSCLAMKKAIRISVTHEGYSKDWDFEVNGSFLEKSCTVNDRHGNSVANVELKEMMNGKDLYHVVVQPGYDQAFVVGVIAVLDNINGESTTC